MCQKLKLMLRKRINQRKLDLRQRSRAARQAISVLCEAQASRKVSVGVGVRYDAPFFCPLQAFDLEATTFELI